MQPFYESTRVYLSVDIRLLVLLSLIGLLGGLSAGYPYLGITVGLLVFILWRGFYLYKLIKWAKHNTSEHPPEVNGLLAILSRLFYKNYKNEAQLRQTLLNNVNRVQSSISGLENAIVLMDVDGSIQWWNPAAENLIGFRKGDQGNNVLNLIREPTFVEHYKKDAFGEELSIASWLEEGKHLKFSLMPFGQENKLMMVSDTTKWHALEQVRQDFIANVSHELKTPLTVFNGYLETFAQQDMNPAWERAFKQMQQQSVRMNNIVNDLLLLSRLDNQQSVTKETRIDMQEVMNLIYDQASVLNKQYDHEIILNIESSASITGNRKDLIGAFANLTTNALKYTPNGGKITLSWKETASQYVFSVTDNGIGIAPEHLQRLTERFYRVDAGRSRETGGTGLGLAIVKHIAQVHKAELVITSELNKGSEFSIVFNKD